MSLQVIDAGLMQKAFLAGAKGLEDKKEWINELNVFPVPDGDTGTNMTMTIMKIINIKISTCILWISLLSLLTIILLHHSILII